MAKTKGNSELQSLEERYEQLTHKLKEYREKYLLLQRQYPPESEYLIDQLTSINSILEVTKREVLAIQKRITEILSQPKVKKRLFSFGKRTIS